MWGLTAAAAAARRAQDQQRHRTGPNPPHRRMLHWAPASVASHLSELRSFALSGPELCKGVALGRHCLLSA
eukprot:3002493-Rhodomonas_salina.2